jgi:hypothetical protein
MLCEWGTYGHNVTSKTIRVTTSSGDIRVKLSNETELDRVLQRNNATCVVDGKQTHIYGFDSLENDGSYTYGPAPAVHALEKRSPRKHAPGKPKKKGGGKKGAQADDKPEAFWFLLCQKYENSKTSWKSRSAFLRSEESGTEVGEDQKMAFCRELKKYRDGKVKYDNETRVFAKQSGYPKRAADHPDRIENPEEVEVSLLMQSRKVQSLAL